MIMKGMARMSVVFWLAMLKKMGGQLEPDCRTMSQHSNSSAVGIARDRNWEPLPVPAPGEAPAYQQRPLDWSDAALLSCNHPTARWTSPGVQNVVAVSLFWNMNIELEQKSNISLFCEATFSNNGCHGHPTQIAGFLRLPPPRPITMVADTQRNPAKLPEYFQIGQVDLSSHHRPPNLAGSSLPDTPLMRAEPSRCHCQNAECNQESSQPRFNCRDSKFLLC